MASFFVLMNLYEDIQHEIYLLQCEAVSAEEMMKTAQGEDRIELNEQLKALYGLINDLGQILAKY